MVEVNTVKAASQHMAAVLLTWVLRGGENIVV